MKSSATFFTTALNYIKDKFPYNDIVVNNAVILDVTKRATVDVTNIYALLERFQGLVEADELASVENEFLEYQLLDDSERAETSYFRRWSIREQKGGRGVV